MAASFLKQDRNNERFKRTLFIRKKHNMRSKTVFFSPVQFLNKSAYISIQMMWHISMRKIK